MTSSVVIDAYRAAYKAARRLHDTLAEAFLAAVQMDGPLGLKDTLGGEAAVLFRDDVRSLFHLLTETPVGPPVPSVYMRGETDEEACAYYSSREAAYETAASAVREWILIHGDDVPIPPARMAWIMSRFLDAELWEVFSALAKEGGFHD